jgi:hypothetical protein
MTTPIPLFLHLQDSLTLNNLPQALHVKERLLLVKLPVVVTLLVPTSYHARRELGRIAFVHNQVMTGVESVSERQPGL